MRKSAAHVQISCVVLALKQDRLLPLWSCTTPTLPADDSQNLNQPLTYMQVLFKLLFAFPFSFFSLTTHYL